MSILTLTTGGRLAIAGGRPIAQGTPVNPRIPANYLIVGNPTGVTVGSPLNNLEFALPSGATTAYASLTINGVEQMPRVAYTDKSAPVLIPQSAGFVTANVYVAETGGTALGNSVLLHASADQDHVTTLTVINTEDNPVTDAIGSRVFGFAKGHVPNARTEGVSLTVPGLAGVQQDGENYWADGSLRSVVLTGKIATLAASTTTAALDIGYANTPPNRTPVVTLAQLAANSNIVLTLNDAGTGVEIGSLSVNNLIANATAFPWGENPTMGYYATASGPLKCGWCFWGFANRWLKVKLWLDAYSTTQFSLCARVEQDTVFGGITSLPGPDAQPSHQFTATLTNNGEVVYNWGGPTDPRVLPLPASAFDPTTQKMTYPGQGDQAQVFPRGAPFILRAAAGGTLPSGLATSDVYFSLPTYTVDIIASTNLLKCRQILSYTIGSQPPLWAAGGYGGYAVVTTSHGAIYTNTTPNDARFSTSGTASVEPTGPGPCVDGTLTWTLLTGGPFTDSGNGTINVIPVLSTTPSTGVALTDLTTFERIWIGGNQHDVVLAPDLAYLTRASGLTPPFNLTADPVARTFIPTPWPSAMAFFGIDLDSTGDAPGDERIGIINHSAACALRLPGAVNERRTAFSIAQGFQDYYIAQADESWGGICIANAGTNKDGTPYPHLPLRTGVNVEPFASAGVAPASFDISTPAGYYLRYQTITAVHLPTPSYGPYLLTGDDFYLTSMVGQFAQVSGAQFAPDTTVSGVVYYRVQPSNPESAGRAAAWSTRMISQINAVLPYERPERIYITDVYNDLANFLAAVLPTTPLSWIPLGAYGFTEGNAEIQPWMEDFRWQVIAHEVWHNDGNPNWAVFLNYLANFVIDRMDQTTPGPNGSEYYACTRGVAFIQDGTPLESAFVCADWHTAYVNTEIDASTTFTLDDQWTSNKPSTNYQPTEGILAPSGDSPWGASSLGEFMLGSLIYGQYAGIPRCADILPRMVTRINFSMQQNGANSGHGAPASMTVLQSPYPEFFFGDYL